MRQGRFSRRMEAVIRLGMCAASMSLAVPAVADAAPPPGSPAYGHQYRHGYVPLRFSHDYATSTTTTTSAANLNYGGGISNGQEIVGVTTGKPAVYLVFWGSQWGSQATNTAGYSTLSGDPSGMAPYLQAFVKGLGTNNESWSGVMTQFCQGVAQGAQTCPASNTQHVGYPTGGALAGVWVDEASAAPTQASGHQLAAEAVAAATHFGNTTQASNLGAQYVIVSPTGTHPDAFNTSTGQFCAWHDFTADGSLSGGAVASPDGYLAFTNLPYLPDMGASCGQNFVNSGSAGALDGVSIVEGHEYAETLTDTYPAGGYVDSGGNEDGDKCAWDPSGQSVKTQNITLATGTFAVQPTWGNDGANGAGACEISHATVTGSTTQANTVTVKSPDNQTSTAGQGVSLQLTATDSASGQTLTYSAAGLPAGLSISASGIISGTPTTPGSYSVTVTAKDTTGASGSTSFGWTVNAAPSSTTCTTRQLLGNPGFETGSASPWSATAGVIQPYTAGEAAHSGSYLAWLDGYGATHTDTLAQTVSVPAGCTNYALSFWLHIDTAEGTTSTAYDTLRLQVLSSSGAVLGTLATFSNLGAAAGYIQHSYSLAAYAGQTVTLKFTGAEDSSLQTSFVLDDAALNVS